MLLCINIDLRPFLHKIQRALQNLCLTMIVLVSLYNTYADEQFQIDVLQILMLTYLVFCMPSAIYTGGIFNSALIERIQLLTASFKFVWFAALKGGHRSRSSFRTFQVYGQTGKANQRNRNKTIFREKKRNGEHVGRVEMLKLFP